MTLNIKPFIVAILSALLVFGMMAGNVQQVIAFADPLNEIAFTFMSAMIFVISLFLTFKK
jgi:hypothetical protein